jgi:transcription initiation factor IIE alpha subunit
VTDAVLECLGKHGQRLDIEIAQETGIPLEEVRVDLDLLLKAGAVILCKVTRFERGHRIDALHCRIPGFIPSFKPGRKAR